MIGSEVTGVLNTKTEEAEHAFEDEELSQLVDSLLADPGHQADALRLRHIVARVERLVIRSALATNGGRKAKTADQLGITREGLYKKMKRLGVG